VAPEQMVSKDLLQIDLAKSAYWISQLKVSISLTPNLQNSIQFICAR